MAWLQERNGKYRIKFRSGGKPLQVGLGKVSKQDADACLVRLEENLRLFERGRLEAPPGGVNLGRFFLSDGKLNGRPKLDRPRTLGELFAHYDEHAPSAAKERTTRSTERIHMKHLVRLLGKATELHSIDAAMLQAYASRRSTETNRKGEPLMFQFAAYTGARRLEMIRAEVDDVDFDAGHVMLREKKRERDKDLTFRTRQAAARTATRPKGVRPAVEVVADHGYDSNEIRSGLEDSEFKMTIPRSCSRVEPIPHDEESYKERNLVERAVARLKRLRRTATRYDKLGAMFLAMAHVSCIDNAIT